MKRTLLLATIAAVALAQSATAGFKISDTRSPVAGSTTLQRIVFSALNDNSGYTAGSKNLFGLELTVTASNPMVFNYADLNGDGRTDVDLTGPSSTLGSAGVTGTKVTSELFGFQFDTNFANIDPTPRHISTATYNAVNAYTNLKSFYGVGVSFFDTGLLANTGTGAKFMTVVAPIGTTVSIVGGIAAENGGVGSALVFQPAGDPLPRALQAGLTPFSYVSAVPEPTTLAAVAGALAVVARRRRA